MKIICVVCGKEVEAQKSTKKYCSTECMNTARRMRYKEQQESKEPRTEYNMKSKICLVCGKSFTPKTPAANSRQCCYDCMPDGTQLKRSGFASLLKQQRGGKCERCGYNKYLGALEFHHIDPSKKEFTIGDSNFRLKECVEEIKKCVLICSNCHKELHANLWSLDDFKREEEVEPDGINQ